MRSGEKSEMRSGMKNVLGVVGSDTEIGKTIVAASLARSFDRLGLRVAAFKPFASDPARRPDGRHFSTDADLLARAARMPGGDAAATGVLLRTPLSPLAAARIEGVEVDWRAPLESIRAVAETHDLVVVEGCGGWEVPLTEDRTAADFFEALGAPLVLVGRSGLGTINHCLLSLAAIRARGLETLAVVLNRSRPPEPGAGDGGVDIARAEETNRELIERFGRTPTFGPLPCVEALARPTGAEVDAESLHDLRDLARRLLETMNHPGSRGAVP